MESCEEGKSVKSNRFGCTAVVVVGFAALSTLLLLVMTFWLCVKLNNQETTVKVLLVEVEELRNKLEVLDAVHRFQNVEDTKTNTHIAKRDVSDEGAITANCPYGILGLPGPAGPPGQMGPPGPTGRDGRDGFPGQRGDDGRDGSPGSMGPAGQPGTPGLNGERGQKGEPGENGLAGKAGPVGPRGLKGDSGVPGLSSNTVRPSTTDTERPHSASNSSGTIYVRWGRKSCPESAELVYEGIIGGSWYEHVGSGSNPQCLPLDPIYDNPVGGAQSQGLIYGSEYETSSFPPLSHLHDHDPVCAVCRVISRSTVFMIPARNECPSEEWTREYYGYLMSEHHGHKRSEYICVDRHAEARDGSHHSHNGMLLYPVEGRCDSGSLPCGPYTNAYELTCAVCTI
ncbi:uncharacterized protein LOC144453724 [Glandiceps talaboti]